MDEWTLIRFAHVVALAFFVGGQLVLVAAVAPALRRQADPGAMRSFARRFGVGAVVALVVLVASGAALASHLDRWQDGILQLKLMLLVLVGVLIGLHVAAPTSRAVAIAILLASLAIVWLGVELGH